MENSYAWLAVNGFIHTQKFEQIFEWLAAAAKKQGCTLEIKTNTQLLPKLAVGETIQASGARRQAEAVDAHRRQAPLGRMPQFVIFWDKDVRLARLLEKQGLRLFNRAESIEICDDKARTFLELAGSGVRMPKTIFGPKTFRPQGYPQLDFLADIEAQLGYPMVIKECYGSFGQQVELVHDRTEAEACLGRIQNRPCLFQEYLAASSGHDIRIQMTGMRATAAMHRYNADDFRANITNGGSMEPYEPTREQLEMAQKVMRLLKLDFAGIDILFGENGEPVLCEVNSNAHFINMFQCTGVNAADAIIRHCLGEIRHV